MARLGMTRSPMLDAHKAREVAHAHVPGVAFEVDDPGVKLVHMLGGGFWNEPRYYDPNRSEADAQRELRKTGAVRSAPPDDKGAKDGTGVTAQARELLETAHAVARGPTPRDLLVVALWARTELHLRTTPQVLLAVAAQEPATKGFVRGYTPRVVQRADELRQVFAAYLSLFAGGIGANKRGQKLPNALKRGLADAFGRFSEAQLMKYDSDVRPTFRDVLRMIDRGTDRGLPKPVYRYLVTGEVTDPDATPVIAARKRLAQKATFDDEARALAKASLATWEVLLSQFGPSRELWSWLVESDLVGYMALLRNLRNLEQAGVGPEVWAKVHRVLTGRGDHKQLPFRFVAARAEVTSAPARAAIDAALDKLVENVPELPGRTFAIVDNSGSALGAPISAKSKLRVSDAGNTLLAVLAKRLGDRAVIGVFGDRFTRVPFTAEDRTMAIKDRVEAYAQGKDKNARYLGVQGRHGGEGVGGSTETGLWWALDDITQRGERFDRVVLLSDLCCYTQGDTNCGVKMSQWFSKDCSVAGMLARYRARVNHDVAVHSVNLSGYGQSQADPKDRRTQLLSGWSETLISRMRAFEGHDTSLDANDGEGAAARLATVPTLEQLRALYG
ncbi:MAG: TROVE domain-containing protein [Deltaproteobacteria bacterium]|nr:TROVE domain-containing protein [Deltaproteobacteria bacterium]